MATILVVDDRKAEREYLVTLFEHVGHRVLEADDGLDAVRTMQTEVPDLVFTDIIMPNMDGFELIRQLRESPQTQSTPVVFYTAAYDDVQTCELAQRSSAATILPKPSEPDVVLCTVRKFLRKTQPDSPALGDAFRGEHLELVTTQLHRRMEELERRNTELLEMNAALERSNDVLRQFTYAAAHDLQEPVRNVLTCAEMLSRLFGSNVDEKSAVWLDECIEGARRIHRMIRGLLEYSTTVQEAQTSSDATDANEVLQEVLENMKTSLANTQAELELGELPAIRVQRTHLVQLFQNIIGNAIKYRRQGVPPRIEISGVCEGYSCTFRIKDNGIGFKPDYGERIFKLFKRLHNREEYSGTGIGLAICSRIVTYYGGRIWADGFPDEGAIFYFTLPVHVEERQPVS